MKKLKWLCQCRESILNLFSNWYLFHGSSYLLKWKNRRHPLIAIVKFLQLNAAFSHSQLPQELSKSDLQALKIWLVHSLGKFGMWKASIKLLKFLQWQSMGICDFCIVKARRLLGINTNLRGDPKLIPYTVKILERVFARFTQNNVNVRIFQALVRTLVGTFILPLKRHV